MCGIAGVYRLDGQLVRSDLLKQMTDVITHRGPDEEGHYIKGPVGLGNRRLSIIDLSPRGRQPISNEDDTIWITYNGETYNFPELRADLLRRGHRFKSDTDTEVVVHLYEEYGIDCLKYLNGMFAFALWDEHNKKLLLARDRLGIKPLFYFLDDRKLLFGSEIKCILCDSEIPRRVHLPSLHHYLSLNYMPAPLTMFEGIHQLLPGQYLLIENGHAQLKTYWDLHFEERDGRGEDYYCEQFEELFSQSVKRMLISDVPFGVFLSGGIDSSATTYFMSKILEEPVKTFSIGFEEESYNELEYARQVARVCHTDHHEQIVKPEKIEDLLPKLIWHSEEPTADASMIPVYYVSKMAREHVKMTLCGDGGDEVLAGYETYQAYYIANLYRKIPTLLRRRLVTPLVNALPVSDKKISLDFKAKRFIKGADLSPERAHYYWRIMFDEAAKRALYTQDLQTQLSTIDTFEETYGKYFCPPGANDMLNRMLYADTRFYLPNDMLVKVDRMSMANSLEVRVPFLDHQLVEFLATVPPSLKLKRFMHKKYLLKKMMADKLPRDVLYRKKQGFNIPVGLWIKTRMRGFVLDTLAEREIQKMGYFQPGVIQQLLREHLDGQRDHGYQLWGLLVFFTWWRLFVGGKRS